MVFIPIFVEFLIYVQSKIYHSSKNTSCSYIKFFQSQLFFSFELRLFSVRIFLDINNCRDNYFFYSFNLLFCNLFFLAYGKKYLYSPLIYLSNLLYFFLLEPEVEASFYFYSYYYRYRRSTWRSKLKLFELCSIKIKNVLSIYQYKILFQFFLYYPYLHKLTIYFFYDFNRQFDSFFLYRNFLSSIFDLEKRQKAFYFLCLTILLHSFDFFLSINCTYFFNFFYFRFLSNFLCVFDKISYFSIFLSKIQRLLLINWQLFSFNSSFIINFDSGFTFLGFNFSFSEDNDCIKIIPSKYNVTCFLRISKKLLFYSMNTSA
jgi:hypothetical protein